jgi:thiol-disulfide isomerase/thioredoxin
MKYFIAFSLYLFLLQNCFGQGIQFLPKETSWSEVLQKAKQENKTFFIDFYTDWCGPCKMMSAKIFPIKSIGDFYNLNFINVKINAEKGEGIEISKQYGINAYPTLIFSDSDGKLLHLAVGAQDSFMLLKLGKEALDPNLQYGILKRKFLANELNPDQLKPLANSAL